MVAIQLVINPEVTWSGSVKAGQSEELLQFIVVIVVDVELRSLVTEAQYVALPRPGVAAQEEFYIDPKLLAKSGQSLNQVSLAGTYI